METERSKKWEEKVVDSVVVRINKKNETAFLAALKRADNPATEYQCWEYLANYNVNLENDWERLPYVTVFAAIARAKPVVDGFLGLGKAIAKCYDDGNASNQAKNKFRRVLACDSVEEVCSVLRPLFSLINSKGVKISYGKMLCDLRWFSSESKEKIKISWAQDFFNNLDKKEEDE